MRVYLVLTAALVQRALAMCAFAQDGRDAFDHRGYIHKRADHQEDQYTELSERALSQKRVLLGDLRYNISTQTGQDIANILLGKGSGLNTASTNSTPPSTPEACAADACCQWYNISSDLLTDIRNDGGGCGGLGAQFIRAGFHDAGTWDLPGEALGGGADGSLVLNPGELSRTNNQGLGLIKSALMPIYQQYNVSMADLIQYASTLATLHCTQGPRMRAWVGRKDSTAPSRNNMLPLPRQTPAFLVNLFANKTIIREDFIALLGAHTISRQYFFNKTQAAQGLPQDTSPELWDVLYYTQMMGKPNPYGPPALRFPSDVVLANFTSTKPFFQKFAASQSTWNQAYANAYVRLSMLGVNNINDLTECSHTLPAANNE